MSDFVVDESRFMLLDDEVDDSFFSLGMVLPDGLIIDEKLDETDKWQLYVDKDGNSYILAVCEDLAQRWFEQGFLKPQQLWKYQHEAKSYYLLISPTGIKLERVTSLHLGQSRRAALDLAAAIFHSRNIDVDVNLRDGIYCQLFGIVLPCFGNIPRISDKALFENVLRNEKIQDENLSAQAGGLSIFTVKQLLKQRQIEVYETPLWLDNGQSLSDFLSFANLQGIVTGPVMIRPHYQIYDTNSEYLILLLDKLWSDVLLSVGLLNDVSANSINVNGFACVSMVLSKRKAVQALDDRAYGMRASGLLELAQALRRTRSLCPQCDLKTALYIEQLGLVLPEIYSAQSFDDAVLIREIGLKGPFALGPFLDEIVADAMRITAAKL